MVFLFDFFLFIFFHYRAKKCHFLIQTNGEINEMDLAITKKNDGK